MADQFGVTQRGNRGQAIGFAGANSGVGNDARFAAQQQQQMMDQFAQSIGMGGIAGAGRFAAFMKTPDGQAKFKAFMAAKQPKPAASPSPAPSPTPVAPSPQPAVAPTPRISNLAPAQPGQMTPPPQQVPQGPKVGQLDQGNPYGNAGQLAGQLIGRAAGIGQWQQPEQAGPPGGLIQRG